MKKPTKQKLVLDPKNTLKQLDEKELDKVVGGWGCIPKSIDPNA